MVRSGLCPGTIETATRETIYILPFHLTPGATCGEEVHTKDGV